GRTEHEILLIRSSDGLEFTYPMMDLSEETIELLKAYPTNDFPKIREPVELPTYVMNKLERVVELRRKVEKVRLEMGEYLVTKNQIKFKGLSDEVERLDSEIRNSNQRIFKYCDAYDIDERDVLEAQRRLITKSGSLFSQSKIGG
ncbi:MAG: hypothetical protein AAF212_13485, partial [Verrucomicrobiota bacterium]